MCRIRKAFGIFLLAQVALNVCEMPLCAEISTQKAATIDATDALKAYLAEPDASFAYKKRREGNILGTDYVEFIMTSQTWRDVPWKHQVFVLKPSSTARDESHALLLIGGGSWKDSLDQPPAANEALPGDAPLFSALAEMLKTPVVVVMHVPHQPMFDNLREDALIAHTFERYIRTGDINWPALLPMTKSAVRAMDLAQEFTNKEWGLKLESFTVTGASKRGWTTWLTASQDPRVTALAPIVIDMLNMSEQIPHQKASFGDLSEEISDFKELGLDRVIHTPPGRKLISIVDPFSYREKIKQPKLLIFGSNDRYWPLDAANLYWEQISGPKYLLYTPNQGHGIRDLDRVTGSIAALHRAARGMSRMPEQTWSIVPSENGAMRISMKSNTSPKEVRFWQSASDTRDFRDAKWTSTTISLSGDSFQADIPKSNEGFRAGFVEAVYSAGEHPDFFLSTNVKIVSP